MWNEPQVARMFMQSPDSFEEFLIRCGSVADLEDIESHMRTLTLGLTYQSPTLVSHALTWFLGTRGANGEANMQALQGAIGMLMPGDRKAGKFRNMGKSNAREGSQSQIDSSDPTGNI